MWLHKFEFVVEILFAGERQMLPLMETFRQGELGFILWGMWEAVVGLFADGK